MGLDFNDFSIQKFVIKIDFSFDIFDLYLEVAKHLVGNNDRAFLNPYPLVHILSLP